MAKLGKTLKLRTTVTILNDIPECPVCSGIAKMHDNKDSFNLECTACGVKGYRYETKAIAIKDFPNHHGLPKRKANL